MNVFHLSLSKLQGKKVCNIHERCAEHKHLEEALTRPSRSSERRCFGEMGI